MLGSLLDLIGGWKQVRSRAGYSYQVSRGGKRRIVEIEGYRSRGLRDEQWRVTGEFADDRLFSGYGRFDIDALKARRRQSAAA